MQCFHPITIKNPKKMRTGGDYNAIQVPCGKCPACLKRKQNDWAFRIMQEAKDFPDSSYFVTITYDDLHLPTDYNCFTGELCHPLSKHEASSFLKKLREYFKRAGYCVDGRAFRFFLCGEYGSRLGRPHYHFCLFTYKVLDDEVLGDLIHHVWSKCERERVTVSRVGVESAKYCAKYCCKQFGVDYEGIQPPFALMSRMPAIGSSWLKTRESSYASRNSIFMVYDEQHTPYAMPKLYKDKLFTPRQRRDHSLECYLQREKSDNLLVHSYYTSYADFCFNHYADRVKHEMALIKQFTYDSIL